MNALPLIPSHLVHENVSPKIAVCCARWRLPAVPGFAPCNSMSEQPLKPDLANLSESQCLRKPDRRLVGGAGAPFHASQTQPSLVAWIKAILKQQAACFLADAFASSVWEYMQKADMRASVFRVSICQRHHADQIPSVALRFRRGKNRVRKRALIGVASCYNEPLYELLG